MSKKPATKPAKKKPVAKVATPKHSSETEALYAIADALQAIADALQAIADAAHKRVANQQRQSDVAMKMLEKMMSMMPMNLDNFEGVKAKAKNLRIVHAHGPDDGPLRNVLAKKSKDEN